MCAIHSPPLHAHNRGGAGHSRGEHDNSLPREPFWTKFSLPAARTCGPRRDAGKLSKVRM